MAGDGPAGRQESIPYVTAAEMNRGVRDHITANTSHEHLWTDDWSPAFYRAQARLGFIAVSTRGPAETGNVLVPELQREYAVLDWPHLVVDRSVSRIIRDHDLDSIELSIERDPDRLLRLLDDTWGDKSWLVPEYQEVLHALADEREEIHDPRFRVLSTVLTSHAEPVAGEIGYAVGRVYVSLSGFFRRGRREWNNYGKLQMVLLAVSLESAGFAFWNLGHAQMEYKSRLGARTLPRDRFLSRWDRLVNHDVPEIRSRLPRSAGRILRTTTSPSILNTNLT